MAKIKCPMCRSVNVQYVGGKVKTSLNLNPLHPFTITNSKPKGKQTFICGDCGHVFEKKL